MNTRLVVERPLFALWMVVFVKPKQGHLMIEKRATLGTSSEP